MASATQESSPPAVRQLRDELLRLHRAAGEPSTRMIAQRLGTGVLSHTSVHAYVLAGASPLWSAGGGFVAGIAAAGAAYRSIQRSRGEPATASDAGVDAPPVAETDHLVQQIKQTLQTSDHPTLG